jgi:hypothetical protein
MNGVADVGMSYKINHGQMFAETDQVASPSMVPVKTSIFSDRITDQTSCGGFQG